MKTNKSSGHKIADPIFWELLKQNFGNYSKTARDIEKHYNVKISRQAVEERAKRRPKKLKDILETVVDVAEGTLLDLLNQKKEKNVRFKAAEFILKNKGRARGYGDRLEVELGKMSENQLDDIISKLKTQLDG